MGKRGRVRILAVSLCLILAASALPTSAGADTGPKPSVRIRFSNMGGELCYGTLLSGSESTGPASAWDGREENAYTLENNPHSDYLPREIWEAFVNYEDPDGYYFLQRGWKVSESREIAWTYYPPSDFKILLYYPETGAFVSGGACERYAFDSYYTVDMAGVSAGGRLEAVRSYDYGREALSLLARVVITVAVEILVALPFGFRERRQLRILLTVNLVTQAVLNVLLNIVGYKSGPLASAAYYALLELAVFAVEAVLYCRLLKRASGARRQNRYYAAYAFAANSASLLAGLFLARTLPGIF